MGPLLELSIRLPPRGSRERLHELHRQLRGAIVDGRLHAGLRLPSTRALATLYCVSRNTVVATYDRLLSEGYVKARAGSGTYIADALPNRGLSPPRIADPETDRRISAYWRGVAATRPAATRERSRFAFPLGVPDSEPFPFPEWRRLMTRAFRALTHSPAVYAEPQGRAALRTAIANHVSFARAVACRPEDIVVTAGAQQAFDLLARVLVTPGRTIVAVEDPGYPPLRTAFLAAGAEVVAVPVDNQGLVVERLPRNARVIYATPSHQFPLGVAMSLKRRTALLEFARVNGAVVIEDDYDSEFRFESRPLDALQTLDLWESVLYVGTFSKSLSPALRLGFIVAPSWARGPLVAAREYADWHSPTLLQDTLAAFITEGHLARHVRKMRRIYGGRRELLLKLLRRDFSEWLEPLPSIAGLHLTARVKAGVDPDELVLRARAMQVGVESLRGYYLGRPKMPGLTFGYGAISDRDIAGGLARLRAAAGKVVP